jgi:hypothetical protein
VGAVDGYWGCRAGGRRIRSTAGDSRSFAHHGAADLFVAKVKRHSIVDALIDEYTQEV